MHFSHFLSHFPPNLFIYLLENRDKIAYTHRDHHGPHITHPITETPPLSHWKILACPAITFTECQFFLLGIHLYGLLCTTSSHSHTRSQSSITLHQPQEAFDCEGRLLVKYIVIILFRQKVNPKKNIALHFIPLYYNLKIICLSCRHFFLTPSKCYTSLTHHLVGFAGIHHGTLWVNNRFTVRGRQREITWITHFYFFYLQLKAISFFCRTRTR